eukprot:gnl/TRDRNA2_/TRDRNA2_176614_c7_seq1.p1 gnl/TRDRNA2_/TRDRNA2_176614_c7~~gnl/TRDRNA2_/TRDRNA2_176614_c7_seq1.p1  ORF type:complete len:611 (+),score=145.72 gnl/TRDRNA2_/TRDRNA2_176614_c7_seq1:83-1834(+)
MANAEEETASQAGSQAGSQASEEPRVDLRSDVEIPDVGPEENVFSYLMFASLWRQGTKGKVSHDVTMAYFLALLCLFMQGVILWAVWNSVVAKNVSWKNSVMNTGQEWDLLAPKPGPNACNSGGSLCFVEDGQFTCAPPTVQLTSRWVDLDINNDGIWTLEEAKQVQEDIKCQLKVNSVEVFHVFIKFLENRKHIIWLHPDVLDGKAIHLPYFKYAAGDIQVCGFKTTDMCPNLLKRGFFDAALTHGTVPRVGNTTESALKYCHALLASGGFCEKTLPSTYSVWKKEAVEECGAPSYSPFTYEHPTSGEMKSMLSVDYEARQDYEMAQTPFHITYKSLIIFLWILAMCVEAKGLVLLANLLLVVEISKDGTDAVEEDGDGDDIKYSITKMMQNERMIIGFFTFCRAVMLMVLSKVGTELLLKQNGYIDLVMDAVSLVFVMEISGILYTQAIRPKAQQEINDHVEPMPVEPLGPESFKKNPALQDIFWIFVVVALVAYVMSEYIQTTVKPLYDALECTCVQKGEKCREAQLFNYDYWYEYWHKTTPGIFRDIAKLKAEERGSLIQPKTFGNLLQQAAKSCGMNK